MGFLKIGDHISLSERYHRQNLASGRDVGTDAHRTLADHAVLRRNDARVGQLIAGHFQRRLRPFQSTVGCVALGAKDLHLLAFRGQYRRGVGQPSGGLIDARACLLSILHRTGTDPGEVVVAVQFMLGEGHLGFGGHDGGLGLGDHRSLTLESRPRILQLRPRHQSLGVGGLGGGAQIAVIDDSQQLPGLDLLVVFHQHVLDKPGHTRRHQRKVRRDKGVIGALLRALAENPRHQQVNQHAERHHRDGANGHFLLCLSRHKNLQFQWSNQVGARGG
ncbi:hypothetical protein PS710_06161 [Pseudomonas fluorescens]|uniref:Uncharacterized protein n=1 Tax=Pseudomonas fluorescens TaxID=294 RepID=A0A5E7FWP1_PSEFL|nr:hypothetical protein PS710_06161 [Pseudomonas fluorescens]